MTHVLLIASCLYINNKEPTDGQDIQRSKACTCFPGSGGRARPFPNDLQCRCGFRSQDIRASKAEGDKDDYSAARKNTTRVLQFMPPSHVMDRVVGFLLLKAGKSDAEQSWMTGYVIIVALAGPDDGHHGQPGTAIASQVTR